MGALTIFRCCLHGCCNPTLSGTVLRRILQSAGTENEDNMFTDAIWFLKVILQKDTTEFIKVSAFLLS